MKAAENRSRSVGLLPPTQRGSDQVAAIEQHQRTATQLLSRVSVALRNATRSHIGRTRQSVLPQRRELLIRLPLQMSRPLWLQYRQIACWTNRGKVRGKPGLNCRASIRLRHGSNNVGAAAGPVAGGTIQVVRVEPGQNAGPAQKVVHERVNRDQPAADLDPRGPTSRKRRSAGWTRAIASTLSETP